MKFNLHLFNSYKILKLSTLCFMLLFIFTINYPIDFIPNIAKHLHPVLITLNTFIARNIFGVSKPFSPFLVSDSLLLYVHLCLLCFISLLITLILINVNYFKKNQIKIVSFIYKVITYYLALQLFNYGFAKIFKTQFYLPEPNTLFTTLGQTNKDLLYWSSMGVSRGYNLFLGSAECLAALLLMFKNTRLLGAFIAFGVLLNILAINVFYDISVKVFSSYLLLCAIVILWQYRQKLFNLFLQQNKIIKPHLNSKWANTTSVILSGYFIFCTCYMHIKTNNFNDDAMARPPLHGAYETTYFAINNEPQIPLITDTTIWRRIFFHRQGYFITQYMSDAMQDYNLTTDTSQKLLKIVHTLDSTTSYFNYHLIEDSILQINGKMGKDSIFLKAKKVNLKALPLMQKEFNLIVE